MELLAAGRNAEVYAYGEGRVLKLDRPDWNGVSDFENEMLELLAGARLPVARPYGTVIIEGRHGVVLERIDGEPLSASLRTASDAEVDAMAERFVGLQFQINTTTVAGLPALLPRLRAELEAEGTVADVEQRATVLGLLDARHDEALGVVHFDLHPDNVLVTTEDHWVVIDWLTVAVGPATADLARTLVLRGRQSASSMVRFLRRVRRSGLARRDIDDDTLDGWIRIVAAARLAEGFEGEEAAWLGEVAAGARRLGV